MNGSQAWKDFFHYNRSERRGLVILFSLLLLIVFADRMIPLLLPGKNIDFSEFEKKVDEYNKRQQYLEDSLHSVVKILKEETGKSPRLTPFPFDPNGLPEEQWLALGLTRKQVRVIKNYENKGGRFNKPGDLAKVYSISEQEFQQLRPFIRINTEVNQDHLAAHTPAMTTATVDTQTLTEPGGPEPGEMLIIELNSADSSDLQQLYGIGPSYAARIINYRKLLGGYVCKEQLLEVYGMDSLRYNNIADNIHTDTSLLIRLTINEADIKTLVRHPYIDYYVARLIVSYRKESGRILSPEELRDRAGLPDTLFKKIRPYLQP